MINTPICDFVRRYTQENAARFHMPGHKGKAFLGCEPRDITEIDGADNLYDAQGIIAQSEAHAGRLFGCHTFYSTEGSSLCIRAMLYLAIAAQKQQGQRPVIAAGRNAHKTFIHTAALLGFDIIWLYPEKADAYHTCTVTGKEVDTVLSRAAEKPCAVFLTSPDYLGHESDIRSIADACHKHGVFLLVDNAHGAYLKFLSPSRHPIDLGADMCCDSAHKTLPVLTGGAYLHIAKNASEAFSQHAREAMALFGSTSPSYLILQSLDAVNPYLEVFRERLSAFIGKMDVLKEKLLNHGYTLHGSEPLKLTIETKPFGTTGDALAQMLNNRGLICEFHDPDYIVFMMTPENADEDLYRLEAALLEIGPQKPLTNKAPTYKKPKQVLSLGEACFSPSETLPVSQCEGRVLAVATVSCPPAVPIVMCGEAIDKNAIALFQYYGIKSCSVVKED